MNEIGLDSLFVAKEEPKTILDWTVLGTIIESFSVLKRKNLVLF